jgi:S-adenosylmethionine-diacylglycerol 3-amino-3-carboxypropyl transferase
LIFTLTMKKALNNVRDKFFKKVHNSNLIYNTCWEDPRIDRQLLDINPNSKIVMITSAGCNALDYLLDDPAAIHCVDVNSRQNALMELKRALIKHGDYQLLYRIFGDGFYDKAHTVYHEQLRSFLPGYAQSFWDDKIKFFLNNKGKKSFYYHGTAGSFAWIFNQFLDSNKKTRRLIEDLFASRSLEEQQSVYKELEPRLMTKIVRWLMNRHITMSLLGVPRPQRQLILDEYPGGVAAYLEENLRNIFTQLPIQDNYFWYLYTRGYYSPECCPNYLVESNFSMLQNREHKVHTHTRTIADFLAKHPNQYTHFILLDHQDWLAAYNPEALQQEWDLILKNAAPGAKVLLRSAALKVNFIPDEVNKRLAFSDEAKKLHKQDRVGTYGSTYLAEIV